MGNGKKFILKGDTTTHGGTVLTAWGEDCPDSKWFIDGRPVACVGDLVSCPQCGGVHRILQGPVYPPMDFCGKSPAVEGCYTSCGAQLKSRMQSRAKHSDEREAAAEAAKNAAMAAAFVEQMARRQEQAAAQIKAIMEGGDEPEDEAEEFYRVVPSMQIGSHFGIFGYVEKTDGGILPDTDELIFSTKSVQKKWMSPDKKRIYFIPESISDSDKVYFGSVQGKLEQAITSSNSGRDCIDSMKKQMQVLKEFRKAYKGQSMGSYNNALYSAHMRYWSVLDYLEKEMIDINTQEYLMAAINEIGGN